MMLYLWCPSSTSKSPSKHGVLFEKVHILCNCSKCMCFNRGVSHYRILPISRDIGWPVQQLDYFRYKATYTDC